MCEHPKPFLTILDVGHGNAAVLSDLTGSVVFDTGKGQHLRRFLHQAGIKIIESMLISHADDDHCGGAISVLRDKELLIRKLYLNPDPTKKDIESHKQLRLAVAEASRERGTVTEAQLTTSLTGRLDCGAVQIEVLYPPPELAMSGVSGADATGRSISSNALCAAIRLTHNGTPIVLLGGDIEFACLNDWSQRDVKPSARVLIFPHHGGLTGTTGKDDAKGFAIEIARKVQPEIVIFSIHKTRYDLPRDEVLVALIEADIRIRFLCTQIPDRLKRLISADSGPWDLHKDPVHGILDGNIYLTFTQSGYEISITP
jgi:beta-lactamase superfamily II metal-dependent hydrolase